MFSRWLYILCALLTWGGVSNTFAQDNYGMTPMSPEAYYAMIQFYEYDRGIPLDARIVGKQETDDYIREKVVFNGVRDSRVPGYLAIPKSGTAPFPIILRLHGLTLSKEVGWDEGQSKHQLLASGFAVLSLDAQYHGERIAQNNYESPGPMAFRDGWSNRFREMLVQSTIEYRRGMDYLATRSDIDTTRIGVLGSSMGGMMTIFLTAVDSRIKVAVDVVSPPMSTTTFNASAIPPSARDLLASISPYNFAHAIVSQPFLMQMGKKDPFYTVEEAKFLHNLITSPKKELVLYDSGHGLPPEYIPRAVEWFQKHLK